jgi:hypothetical protein
MTFTTPMIGITIAVVFFYLKLVYMQWRKARKAAGKTNLEIAKARKQGKTPKIPEKPAVTQIFNVQVKNWFAVAVLMACVFVGFALSTMQLGLPVEVTDYSWVLVAAGIVGLSFAIK